MLGIKPQSYTEPLGERVREGQVNKTNSLSLQKKPFGKGGVKVQILRNGSEVLVVGLWGKCGVSFESTLQKT